MQSIYQKAFTLAYQLTGNKRASRKIVKQAIEEGTQIALKTKDVNKAHRYIIATVRVRAYEWNERKHLKPGALKRIKIWTFKILHISLVKQNTP